MNRNDYFDFLKGTLIILVFFGHGIQYGMYNNINFWSDDVFNSIYLFHMPAFILISGYFASKSNKEVSLKNTIYNKSKLLIPIFSWALFFNGVRFLFVGDVGSLERVYTDFITSLWFLWVIFIIFILHCFVLKSKLLGVFMGGWVLYLSMLPSDLIFYQVVYLLPFFMFGYFFELSKIINFIDVNVFGFVLCLLSILTMFFLVDIWPDDMYIYISKFNINSFLILSRWVLVFLSVALFLVVATFFYKLFPPSIVKMISNLGLNTLPLYIISIYIQVKVINMLNVTGDSYVFCFLISFSFVIIFNFLLKKVKLDSRLELFLWGRQ